MREQILSLVQEQAHDGQLSCVRAMAVAAQLGVTPGDVGMAVNRATALRIYRCQLGLFGYGPKDQGKHKIVQPAARVADEIAEALTARAHEGRIACREVWQVAEQFEYPRLGVSLAAEALGLKVSPCQLGCF